MDVEIELGRLGVKRLLLAIQDVSFPSDGDEDIGRGSSATRAAARLFAYARRLGFTGIQLGPQGQTTRGNPSPYDGTIFSRHVGNIGLAALSLAPDVIAPWLVTTPNAQHAHAFDAIHALLEAAYPHRDRAAVQAFCDEHASWLVRDARAFDSELDRYAFAQWLAAREHARVRDVASAHHLALYGDLHVGYATSDAAAYADAFLADYQMGAPPSRTNPDGQPWGYPVLDPQQYAGGRARELVLARLDKMFDEYDSVRVDHPHGLVCPWVYRDARDVAAGARLFDSPDVAELARYAIARLDQLDRTQPRYADGWVRELDAAQIDRYSVLVDAMIESARRARRDPSDLSFEVLSTMPYPLGAVLARHGLGRWRVLQKANLADASDVYRSENAKRADWVMLGNHDTAPIFAVIAGWSVSQRETWARHLAARLKLSDASRLTDDGFIANAMLAELLVSDAENVQIFFADLFGYTERFNVPGVVADSNWSLRLPADFERLHAERLAAGRALDLSLAAHLAFAARSYR